ncbi:MAG TPA: BatA domain-containing protein [Salinimicrobium sp.]|nr:BatA domain-containing protein [Salinimicrobium sp.]
MQFKYPELLYALFLLLIPILIHLFQLRKFKKEAFTNLKFLKKISLQTRKSSKLKKWLILLTRMLFLAALVIAFAQPYFLNSENALQEQEVLIYLDNSYSMEATGNKGRLLERSVQELLETMPEDQTFSLFTNDKTFKDISISSAKKELLQINFSPNSLDLKSIGLKAGTQFSELKNTDKHFILISDFQKKMGSPDFDSLGFKTHLIKLQPENVSNISIDTAFLETKNTGKFLYVQLSKSGNIVTDAAVSVYNKDELIAKTGVEFLENNKTSAIISLPNNEIVGKILVNDKNLQFDNELFFTIEKPEPVNIIAINEADDDFLHRIFTEPDFSFSSFQSGEVNYKDLANSDFIVLNQLKTIPKSLSETIENLISENVGILIIPDSESNLENYNKLFYELNIPPLSQKKNQQKLVANISFSHPVYEGVFDAKVDNFEYPKVQSFFEIKNGGIPILSFEDNKAFLIQQKNIYLFTAALDKKNSNFQNSPLIVPTLFNIGKSTLGEKKLYYVLGDENVINIPVALEKDEILEIKSEAMNFIPLQQSFSNNVSITTNELPDIPGNFSVVKEEVPVANISYNLDRSENILNYSDLKNGKNIETNESISEVIGEIYSENNISELWKWFVIFALLFLLIEMLILKFLK